MNFLEILKNHYILTDGAMGTYYAQLYQVEGRMSELANTVSPQQIEHIHDAYIEAGARLLRTNSFASHAQALTGLPLHQAEDCASVLKYIYDNVYQSYKIAERSAAKVQDQVWIAGDIGPIPLGGDVDDEDVLIQYRTMADALLDAGAEIILFETFADFDYILPTIRYIKQRTKTSSEMQAVLGAQDKLSPVIMTSFCLNKFGYTKSGLSVAGILKAAKESGLIDVVGFNCGIGSTHMKHIIDKLDLGDMLVSIVPNSGYPDMIRDRNIYQDNVAYFSENMIEIAKLGVNALGGCCGTTPEYIKGFFFGCAYERYQEYAGGDR